MLSATDKSEIRGIVSDEFDKLFKSEFDAAMSKALKTTNTKREVVNIVRASMVDLFKFMWNKRTTWGGEIKGGN